MTQALTKLPIGWRRGILGGRLPRRCPVLVAHLKIDAGGRIVIPKEFRDDLGVKPGDEVTLLVEPGGILVSTQERLLRRSREIIARHVPPGVSLVDELIAERSREVAKEVVELSDRETGTERK